MSRAMPEDLIKKVVEFWKLDPSERDRKRSAFAEECRRLMNLEWIDLDDTNFEYEEKSWLVKRKKDDLQAISSSTYATSALAGGGYARDGRTSTTQGSEVDDNYSGLATGGGRRGGGISKCIEKYTKTGGASK
jgi:hypothetical protein